MSLFRKAVEECVSDGLRSLTHPVQGYISAVDAKNNVCTVRISNPHGGIHPANNGTGNYIELSHVPLPFYVGILTAVDHLLKLGDRGVLVGFKGANMAFPYIISPLSLVPNQDKMDQTVDDRKNVVKDRALSQTGAQVITPPDQLIPQLPGVQSFDELFAPDVAPPAQSPLDDSLTPALNATNSMISSQLDNSILRDITPITSSGF